MYIANKHVYNVYIYIYNLYIYIYIRYPWPQKISLAPKNMLPVNSQQKSARTFCIIRHHLAIWDSETHLASHFDTKGISPQTADQTADGTAALRRTRYPCSRRRHFCPGRGSLFKACKGYHTRRIDA